MSRPIAPLRLAATAPLVALVGLLCGCSSAFNEKYYVGVFAKPREGPETPTQFYRFRLDGGSSLFCKTKFEAGWYDARAVDTLFGQIRDEKVIPAGPEPAPGEGVTALTAAGAIPEGGKTAVQVEGARVQPLTGRLPLRLENIASAWAPRLRITVKKTKDGYTVVAIRAFARVRLTYAKAKIPAALAAEELSVRVRPAGAGSTLSCGNFAELRCCGGRVRIATGDAKLQDDMWRGTCLAGSTESRYGAFQWKGGRFEATCGQATRHQDGVDLRSGYARFANLTSLSGRTGWLLDLRKAKLDLQGVRASVRVPEKGWLIQPQADSDKLGELKKDLLGKDHEADVNEVIAKLDSRSLKVGKTDEVTIELKKKDFQLKPAGKEVLMRLTGDAPPASAETKAAAPKTKAAAPRTEAAGAETQPAPPKTKAAAVEATVDAVEVEALRVKTASSFIVSSVGCGDGVCGGVAPRRSEEETAYYRFGPEGVAKAQREGERFVIFMVSNPRALTRKIKALLDAGRAREAMTALIHGPRMTKDDDTIAETEAQLAGAAAFAEEMKRQLSSDEADLVQLKENWSRVLGRQD